MLHFFFVCVMVICLDIVDFVQTHMSNLESQNERLNMELSLMKKQLEKQNSIIKKRESDANHDLQQLLARVDALQDEKMKLQKENEQLKNTLKNEKETFKFSQQSILDKNQELQEQLQSVNQQLTKRTIQQETVEKELRNLRIKHNKAAQESADFSKHKEDSDIALKKLKASNKSLNESKTKLEQTIKQLQKELETIRNEYEKVQGRHNVVSNVRENAFRTIEKVSNPFWLVLLRELLIRT